MFKVLIFPFMIFQVIGSACIISDLQLYDTETKESIGPPFVSFPGKKDNSGEMQESQRPGWPCSCQSQKCGCCFGMNLERWNMTNQIFCGNMIYDPIEFSISLNMLWNENELMSRSWSGKNPSPMCIPIPIPNIPILVEMCMKLYNVFQPGNNLHMCMDVEILIQKFKIMVLHFDCIRMGQDFAFMKPDENGGINQNGEIATVPE